MIKVERKGLDSVVVVNDRPVIVTKNHWEALMLAEVGEKGEHKIVRMWPRPVR